jgi:hypothetical protein
MLLTILVRQKKPGKNRKIFPLNFTKLKRKTSSTDYISQLFSKYHLDAKL